MYTYAHTHIINISCMYILYVYIYNYAGLSKNAGYPEPAILMRTWWSVMEFGGSFAAKILSPSPMTNSPGVSGIARMITWLLDLGNILCIFCVYLYIYIDTMITVVAVILIATTYHCYYGYYCPLSSLITFIELTYTCTVCICILYIYVQIYIYIHTYIYMYRYIHI